MMALQTVGVLHPGNMGVTVASSILAGGRRVIWASEHRSDATAQRARREGLEDVGSLKRLLAESHVVISVCPPHAALDVALAVAQGGFNGIYVDVNAVSPATALKIMETVAASSARFVDGGIIGPPARKPGTTRLYLSGENGGEVRRLFDRGAMEAVVIGKAPGAASALKMCYAAWTKGSSALLMAVGALAVKLEVMEALLEEWAISQPGLEARLEAAAANTAPKAWRFVGEMKEIASTFEAAGLPGGFHSSAADLYGRLEGFKDPPLPIDPGDVLDRLSKPDDP